EYRQIRVVGADRGDHRVRLFGVVDDRVVQRAVRFDVADPAAAGAGQTVERTDLIDHVRGQLGRGDVDEPATETGQVVIADLGADRHVPVHGRPDRTEQGRRVAGVESAGDVGAGDQFEHRVVVTEPPGAVALAQIAVDVDLCHGLTTSYPVSPGASTISRSGRRWSRGRTQAEARAAR